MDIRNCRRCGNIYNYNGTAVCSHCAQLEQEDFDKVRDYLFEHPNSQASEISEDTGVDIKVISRFLKEGRLKMESEHSGNSLITCENCGASILSGRFCEKCLQEMQSELKKTIKPGGQRDSNNNNNSSSSINNNINTVWSQAKVHTYDHILKKKD